MLIDKVESSENREVRKSNAPSVARRRDEEEEMKQVQARDLLTQLKLVFIGIQSDVDSDNDAMKNFIAEELRFLETSVRGATVIDLKGLLERLRDAVWSDPPGHRRAIGE